MIKIYTKPVPFVPDHTLGRPTIPPTEQQVDIVTFWAGESMVLSNMAGHAGIHVFRLKEWLEVGGKDCYEGRVTIYSQLYLKVVKNRSNKVSMLLKQIQDCPKNWQALAWILEKTNKEDFASEGTEYKQLLELYQALNDQLIKLKASKLGMIEAI